VIRMEKKHGMLFLLVLMLNVAAVLIGLWFYSAQLLSSSLLLWLFIPDCPLYVFLCILMLLGKIKSETLNLIIAASTLKYGLWTILVLFFYGTYYFSPADILMYSIFMLGHIGMAAQGFLLLPKETPKAAIFLLLAWFLLNDFADYALGAHPSVPIAHVRQIALFTLALSFSIAVLLPLLQKGAHSKHVQSLRSMLF